MVYVYALLYSSMLYILVVMKSAYVRGFTIVELIVVIVVVAILAGISIVAYTGITDDARAAKTASELKSVDTASEIFFIKNNGRFPQTLGEVSSMGVSVGVGSKISWHFDSYYGSYSKQGDGVVKGEYRIFSVAEDFYTLYYDYGAKTWQRHRKRNLKTGGFNTTESLNCSANVLDDCLSS